MSNKHIEFGPYGVLGQDYLKGNPSPPATPPRMFHPIEKWEAWLEKVMQVLNATIWPSWDSSEHAWKPGKAVENMLPITELDFKLFEKLDELGYNRGFETNSKSPNRTPALPPHSALFRIEDGSLHDRYKQFDRVGAYYSEYDSKIDKDSADSIPPLFFRNEELRMGGMNLYIKHLLQRPRPYQTALLLGIKDYVHQKAQTSHTPSACSGHCLQGVMCGAGVAEELMQAKVNLGANNGHECLQQFSVDFGDRRVMAGVHYASDNLSSWIIALAAAEYVYRRDEMRGWILEAITKRSLVYDQIKSLKEKGEATAYEPALKALEEIGQKGLPV